MLITVLIQFVILFIILYVYAEATDKGDGNNGLRALIVAISIPVLGLLPDYMGGVGWVIGVVLAVIIIAKVFGQSITGAALFLLAIGLLQYLLGLALVQVL